MHRRAGWLLGRIARSHATHVAAACLLVERNRRSALAESSTPGAERVANLAAPRLRRTSSLAPQVLIADRRIEDDYILGPPLGSGTYAVVRQGTNRRTGKLVAVKQVPKTKQHTASILHEVSVLQRVSMHTCISELEGCYEGEDSFYIVMEYVGGGELFDHLCKHGAYSERDAARLLQASGVPVYAHVHCMCTCMRTLHTALHACRNHGLRSAHQRCALHAYRTCTAAGDRRRGGAAARAGPLPRRHQAREHDAHGGRPRQARRLRPLVRIR